MKKYTNMLACSAVSLLLVSLAGCGNQDPLERLKQNHAFEDMTPAYWEKVQTKNPATWNEAKAYCNANMDKPNCTAVIQRAMSLNGTKTAPAIGHSGESIHLPTL